MTHLTKSIPPFLAWALLCFAALAAAAGVVPQAQAREIAKIQRDINAQEARQAAALKRVSDAKNKVSAAEGALRVAEGALAARKAERESALVKLKKVQALTLERPEVSTGRERRVYALSKAAHDKAAKKAAARRESLAQARAGRAHRQTQLDGVVREMAALRHGLALARFEKLRRELEREQVVEARGEASCGNASIAKCKRLALAEARRQAVERGSAMLVDSVTQVENYQLTRDQIRSRVRGIITSMKELEKGFVGDSGYFYRIRAAVKGQLPEGMRPEPPGASTGPGAPSPALARTGPVPTWERTFGGGNTKLANAVAPTADGGYIVVGTKFRRGDSTGWLTRLDAQGNKLWERNYGAGVNHGVYDVAATADGGFVLAGRTAGEGFTDAWIVRVTGAGSLLWKRRFGDIDSEQVNAVATADDGGFLVAGSKGPFTGRSSGWLIRLDRHGNKLWERSYGEFSSFSDFVPAGNEGFLLVGGVGRKGTGVMLADNRGRPLWDRTFGSGWAKAVATTADGGYILAGSTKSKNSAEKDAWVIRLDNRGNKLWERTFGNARSDHVSAVATTKDGGYVVAGVKNLIKEEKYKYNKYKGGDAWLIRLDGQGNKHWERTFGGRKRDSASAVASTADGGYILVGTTEPEGAGKMDAWVLKLNGQGRLR